MEYNISKILRNKEAATQVSADEFFQSDELKNYLDNTAQSITGRWTNPLQVSLVHSNDIETVAFTDNNSVVLNTCNPLTQMIGGLAGKFKCLLGIFYHELAHVLYTDFKGEEALSNRIMSGHLPFCPEDNGPAPKEMKQLMGDRKFQMILANLYNELSNFASDNHDENQMITAYEQYCKRYSKSEPLRRKTLTKD